MLMGVFWRQRLSDCVRANPFFFLRRKKNSKRKSCKGDAPLTPAEGSDTTTVCGSSGEDEVQAAQRGQVKARTVKRPAANILLGFPAEGKAERTAFTRIPNLSPLCTLSLLATAPGLPVPGGSRGAEPH